MRFIFLFLLLINQVYSQGCDCSATWTTFAGGPSTLPYPIYVYTTPTPRWAIVPEQAKHLCYIEPVICDGFIHVPSQNAAWLFLYVYPITTNVSMNHYGGAAPYLNVSVAYELDRFRHYDCVSKTGGIPTHASVFDAYDYYFSLYRSILEVSSSGFCPFNTTVSGVVTCCWSSDPGACTTLKNPTRHQATVDAVDQSFATLALIHYVTIGIAARNNPNVNCHLKPLLWSNPLCTVPASGCETGASPYPCGEHGYCMVNPNNNTAHGGLYRTPYQCNCLNYTNNLFGGSFKYTGNACQYATRDFCTGDEDETSLCSEHNDRCRIEPTNNPNGPLDYHPYCECNNASAIGTWPAIPNPLSSSGTYCQTDRCDPTNRCKILGSTAGECQKVGNSFKCVCSTAAVGTLCQYSTAPCKYSTDTVNCHAKGVCIAPNTLPTSPTGTLENFNTTSPWCSCNDNQSHGKYCELVDCDPTVVTPGRGMCNPVNGNFISCYTPMFASSGTSGSLLCDINKCAMFGGTVIGSDPPTGCDCGIHYLNISKSCWPLCPIFQGVECGPGQGVEVNTCQRQAAAGDTARYAYCICGSGFIHKPANATNYTSPIPGTVASYCEKYCIHGDIDEDWTEEEPTPCLCDGTGFTIFNTETGEIDYRCGIRKCKNNAPYNATLDKCICPFSNMTEDCRFDLNVEAPEPPRTSESNPWNVLDGGTAGIVTVVLSVGGVLAAAGYTIISHRMYVPSKAIAVRFARLGTESF